MLHRRLKFNPGVVEKGAGGVYAWLNWYRFACEDLLNEVETRKVTEYMT